MKLKLKKYTNKNISHHFLKNFNGPHNGLDE